MTIKKGDKVKVEYTGTLEDGTVFDSTQKRGQPLEFEVGAGKLIKGFDDAVIGMSVGEEKQVKIPPADAYGESRPELIKEFPKDKLPPEVKAGSVLLIQLPNGIKLPVRVVSVDDKTANLDLNHPLAGKTLNFKIKVVG